MSVSLGRLVDINPATPEFDRVPDDEQITFLPLEACWPDGRVDLSRRATRGSVAIGYTRFRRGDVLMPKITPTFEAGRVLAVDSPTPVGAGTTELHVLRAHPGIEPRFIAYLCRSQAFLQEGHTSLEGVGNLRRVPIDFVRLFPVAVPDGEDQSRIADYLDRETAQIDALIGKQERLIETLRERRRALAESVIDRPQDVGGRRLKHYVRSVSQGWSPQCYPWPADGVREWAVLKAGAPNAGRFRPEENKALPPSETPRPEVVVREGQVLISRASTRDLVGSAAVVVGHFPRLMLSDKLYALSLDESAALPQYVALALGTRAWRGLIELEAGGTSPSMQNISQADILNLPLRLPSLAEQARRLQVVASKTVKVDALIAKAEQLIVLARERRSALITAAVTGQIDVRTAA